jgi:hypothetical protein
MLRMIMIRLSAPMSQNQHASSPDELASWSLSTGSAFGCVLGRTVMVLTS